MKQIYPSLESKPGEAVVYKTNLCDLACYSTDIEGYIVNECCFLIPVRIMNETHYFCENLKKTK